MRILHVLASSLGGGSTHVFDLIAHKADGIEQRLALPSDGGTIAERFRGLGYKVEELDLTQGWQWKAFFRLMRYIRGYQPHIVHCHGYRAGLYGRLATKLISRNIKTVITVHGFHAFYYKSKLKKKLIFSLEKILQKWTDHVIAVSNTDWQHLLQCGLISKEKSQVILNGIQPITSSSKEKARSILNISNSPIIATICRLHYQKGV